MFFKSQRSAFLCSRSLESLRRWKETNKTAFTSLTSMSSIFPSTSFPSGGQGFSQDTSLSKELYFYLQNLLNQQSFFGLYRKLSLDIPEATINSWSLWLYCIYLSSGLILYSLLSAQGQKQTRQQAFYRIIPLLRKLELCHCLVITTGSFFPSPWKLGLESHSPHLPSVVTLACICIHDLCPLLHPLLIGMNRNSRQEGCKYSGVNQEVSKDSWKLKYIQ